MMRAKIVSVALAGLLLAASSASAFHSAGVAECAGCHTMHNSQDGALITDAGGHEYLLKANGATAMCLSCHAAYGQYRGGTGYGPGGDFYWLTKTFSWTSHGSTVVSTGDSHGHNVIYPGQIAEDATLAVAPGGDFDSSFLGCTSCHDPHGNQNFRLLYGAGAGPIYPGGLGGRYDFDEAAPIAKGDSRRTYVGGGGNETNSQHTLYKSGMGLWCANCHTDFHSDNTADFVHDIDEPLNGLAANYNAYVSSDNQTGGSRPTAYWGLVPFQIATAPADFLTNPAYDVNNYTIGPLANDEVTCISCHRAHASAFPDAGRWDFGETFIVESHPKTGDTGASADDIANKYYQYTFVNNQRSLCNKCHVKDFADGPYAP